MLVAVAVLLQSIAQIVAVTVLRRRQPDLRRPYRQWLYPLPTLLALAGWIYVYVSATSTSLILSWKPRWFLSRRQVGQRIAVGGGLIHHLEWLPALDNVLRRAVPFPPELVIARFSQGAPLAGAIVHALDCAGNPEEDPVAVPYRSETVGAYPW